MPRRLLVANRGEIAVRIIRSARELGIETVAVHSSVDAGARHTEIADVAVALAGHPVAAYLDRQQMVDVARAHGCDAIHPGYGFISEDPEFAALVRASGLVFVGPSAESIRMAGDKAAARKIAAAAGVPVVPGSQGEVVSGDELLAVAEAIGYPMLLKAAAGGGGRGMRIVEDRAQLEHTLPVLAAEAAAAFGNGALYAERFLPAVRHIEVQVLADHHGNVVHLGERECSVQRRHQKLIEEAPAPALDPATRAGVAESALAIARAVGYESAGTVEFIVDATTNEYFFIEMNTRIQVEHGVTEEITGIDIVEMQLRIADGEPLGLEQADVQFRGHAIECRITAEDHRQRFLPSPGEITRYRPPSGPGVRVDDQFEAGREVLPFYDSLVAKVIAFAPSRERAIARMERALGEFAIDGISVTTAFHLELLRDPQFLAGAVTTRHLAQLGYE